MTPRLLGIRWYWVAGVVVLLWLQMWVSSGTLNLYAATLREPWVDTQCGYLLNSDHPHFKATYLLLQGAPRAEWEFSVVLRRNSVSDTGLPVDEGCRVRIGRIPVQYLDAHRSTACLHVRVCTALGGRAAAACGVLVATYPGVAYWAGSPYSYAAIVPSCLLAYVCLIRVDESESGYQLLSMSGLIGCLFLAYDIFAFFVPALVLLLDSGSDGCWIVPALLTAVLPMAIVGWAFQHYLGISPVNNNTVSYTRIFMSFAAKPDFSAWAALLALAPGILLHNYFYANFVVLPLGFIVWFTLALGGSTSVRRGWSRRCCCPSCSCSCSTTSHLPTQGGS